jgi:hypothetical protein
MWAVIFTTCQHSQLLNLFDSCIHVFAYVALILDMALLSSIATTIIDPILAVTIVALTCRHS